jgi:SAM-dependent methyltransferase
MDEPPATPVVEDPRAYWEERLGEEKGLGGVGYAGLGESFNRWGYRARRRVFLRTVRPLVHPGARVLDLGSGTGFYLDRWRELGAGSIVGSDITEGAVERLAARNPDLEIVRFDAGDSALLWEQASFDAISAMDVLFHVVDDERVRRALRNAAALLRPGGALVFSDVFLHGETWRAPHQAVRSLDEVTAAVRAAGLDVQMRRPLLVLLNPPVDSDSRALRATWWLLRRAALRGELPGAVAGALAYPAEVALAAALQEGPSTEIMVCHRPVPGDRGA